MDAYPAGYVEHNLPFILLFGLDVTDDVTIGSQEQALLLSGGFVIKSELPPVSGDRARSLVQELLKADGNGRTWTAKGLSSQSSPLAFRFRRTGRVGQASITLESLHLTPSAEIHHSTPEGEAATRLIRIFATEKPWFNIAARLGSTFTNLSVVS